MRAPHRRDQRQWMDVRQLEQGLPAAVGADMAGRRCGEDRVPPATAPLSARLGKRTSYPFFIFHRETDDLVGGITLSNLRRGVTQAGTIGYWMGLPYVRRGHMAEAVDLILEFAFEGLGLHRVEAACLVHNEPSNKLLLLGFSEEGLARQYLQSMGGGRTIGRSAFCAAIGKRRANFDG